MPQLLAILTRSSLALLASAVLLLAALQAYIAVTESGDTNQLEAIEIPGNRLQTVIGGSEPRGEQLAITRYESREGQFHAIAVWKQEVPASNYALLSYQLDADKPPVGVRLFWRSSVNPEGFFIIDLDTAVGEPQWLDLTELADWQGTVLEIGFFIVVQSPQETLLISRLSLEPLDTQAALASHWSHWTSFRSWSASSINFLRATDDVHWMSPVPVAAVWAGVAAILLLCAGVFGLGGGKQHRGAIVAVLLLPWILLDLLWQSKLSTQLAQTREQFAGKTMHERHLVDLDSPIYQYALRLKAEVLPAEPSRILLLHGATGHNFDRLKAQYYLLPHNIYNLTRVPPNNELGGIDYILVLGNVEGLEFHEDGSVLRWRRGRKQVAVELLDADPMGSLYRVNNRNIAQESPQ